MIYTMTIKEYLMERYSKSTLNSNLYEIKRFTDYYGKKAEKANYQDILKYVDYMRKNFNLHPKTLKNCLYAVKIYFNYLLETGKRKDHPCSELNLKDKINKQIQVDNLYSEQTLEGFFETACPPRRKQRLDSRNKTILSLLIYQALRVTEIAELTVTDIDLEKGEIFIREQSNKQERILPLKAKQIMLFYKYLYGERLVLLGYNKTNPNEKAFILGQYGQKIKSSCISGMINEYRPKTERITPQKIRQSVIANLLRKENDPRIVQVFAGHKRISTTQQYRQNDFEALKTAVNQYHPLLKLKII
jgi:integrase/recombinase XerD